MEKIRQKVENTQSSFRDFATTLQIVIVKHVQDKRFISSFWVGDGAVAVLTKKIRLLGQTDGGDYVGQTGFLKSKFRTLPSVCKHYNCICTRLVVFNV